MSIPSSEAIRSAGDYRHALRAYEAALEAGRRPDRAAFLASHPDIGPELADALDALDVLYATRRQMGPGGAAADGDGDTATVLGDFRLLREVGRGGMGVVYEAVQVSLGRRVAVKVLPGGLALDRKALARFENEARAAALLQHPHVVPVYTVGCAEGVHYYVMQYVEGPSLAAVLADRRQNRTPPRPGPDDFRTAARWGVQAAEALHCAHEAGIVHRDVKPANLLIDRHGRLWVSDFGLARVQGAEGLTATGGLLGTARYMSPEQARGDAVAVDHRADVYALGVTLYELLTLEPAYDGPDPQAVLARIQTWEPEPPRRRNPRVPFDLETVVLKAMAREPADRYATAQELADDLGRYLCGEPVLARRPTPADRARRWLWRKRRPVVVVLATLIAGVIGGLAADNYRIERALAKAEASRDQARRALGQFYKVVERVLHAPGEQEWKRAALKDAMDLYDEIDLTAGDDPIARYGLARVSRFLAELHAQLVNRAQALPIIERAVRELEALRGNAAGIDPRPARAAAYHCLEVIQSESGLYRESAESARRSVALYRELVAEHPGKDSFLGALAEQVCALAKLELTLDDRDPAARHFQEARSIMEPLVAKYPEDPLARIRLIRILGGLADLHNAAGRTDDEIAILRQAVERDTDLAQRWPRKPEDRVETVACHERLADLLARRGQLDEAERLYRDALTYCMDMARRYPDAWDHHSHQLGKHRHLADLYWTTGRTAEAAREYTETVRLGDEILRRWPDNDHTLAWFANLLTYCPYEPLRDVPRALALARKATELAPQRSVAWQALAVACYHSGDWAGARAAGERALSLPTPVRSRADLLLTLSLACARLGDRDAARGHFAAADAWLRDHPAVAVDFRRERGAAAALLDRGEAVPR